MHKTEPTSQSTAYRWFIEQAFDRDAHNVHYRCMVRWLYRKFRRYMYASPFSARADVANFVLRNGVAR